MDPLWDDGRAEVSIYEAVEVRYAQPRTGQVVQILVKEDHLPGTWVKADDPSRAGLVPVLKFNWIFKVPTGVYSYEQMLSAFLRRSDLRLGRDVLPSGLVGPDASPGLHAQAPLLHLRRSGIWIYHAVFKGPAPSMRAASITSDEIVLSAPYMMMIHPPAPAQNAMTVKITGRLVWATVWMKLSNPNC